MATFDFFTDKKVTMWERVNFEIEADTYNQAVQKAIEFSKNDNFPVNSEYETLYDTAEPLSVKENGGETTIELFKVSGQREDVSLWNNKDSLND
jgi:hypothetical protein